MPSAARLTDLHTCPLNTTNHHVAGSIIGPGVPTVLIGNLPAAVVSDHCICAGKPDLLISGSATVFIGGKPAARQGDKTANGGNIITGSPTVITGG